MISNKIFYIFVIILTLCGLVVYYYFLAPTVYVSIDHGKIEISSTTIRIPVSLHSLNDAVYHIYLIPKQKIKKQIVAQPDYVLMLKKGQKHSFCCQIERSVIPANVQWEAKIVIKEIIPKKRKYEKRLVLQLQPEKLAPKQEVSETITQKKETTLVTKTVPPQQELQIKIKEKPDFDIILSSDMLKHEYSYEDVIKIVFVVKNRSASMEINPQVSVMLKKEYNIIISSKTTVLNLKPEQMKENFIEIEIPTTVVPGEYFIEISVFTKELQRNVTSPKFHIIDRPPKIVLPELPVIKHKFTNTILAEVEDDREITEVKIVEIIDEKKNVRNEYQMILIAGNKKMGLYSFTTAKILRKDLYRFYIQAQDIAGNLTKTEVYNIKITK